MKQHRKSDAKSDSTPDSASPALSEQELEERRLRLAMKIAERLDDSQAFSSKPKKDR